MEGAPALLEAAALAARSALLGGAAFLVCVSNPLARRVPPAQAAMVMARTRAFILMAALATVALAALQLAGGQFFALGVLLVALPIPLLAPRKGPAHGLGFTILALAATAMFLAVGGGRIMLPGLAWSTLLREAGAALWMGNLPLLWMLLRPAVPPAVAQAVGMRHVALMLVGMALAMLGLGLAWPHRTLLVGPQAFGLLAITVAFVLLAQMAAGLRVGLLIAAGRAAPAASWLPRLRFAVEAEVLLAMALCGPIIALFTLATQGLVPAPAPDLAAALPGLSLHPWSGREGAGIVLLLIAVLAWLHRAGGATAARLAPLLLVPLGAAIATRHPVLGLLVLLAGMAEAWVAWRGNPAALPFPVVVGVVVVLASRPPAAALLPCLLVMVALLARWAALRLSDPAGLRAAHLVWPLALGALGLSLILADGG